MTRIRAVVSLALMSACGSVHSPDDAGPDASDASFDAGVDAARIDARVDAAVDGGATVVRCGAAVCADGESCCFSNGTCFDAELGAEMCPEPTRGECSSNRDCADGEVCRGLESGCLGEGRCVDTGGCSLDSQAVCGCDGVTYDDRCAAQEAGVRVSEVGSGGECGAPQLATGGIRSCDEDADCPQEGVCDTEANGCVWGPPRIACGRDDQCPEGSECCAYTGACVDSACDDCCRQPPDGTFFPCRRDADCYQFDLFLFCQSAGCGDAPGGCTGTPSTCGGELAPVCGCDGIEYSNECWAHMEGVDVDPDGASCS